MMGEAFPGNKCSSVEVSRLVQSAFPSVEKRRETKGKKEIFYVGLERLVTSAPSPQTSQSSLESLLMRERAKTDALITRVYQLEEQIQSMQQYDRVATYKAEFSNLLSDSTSMLCCGPNSLQNLDSFSLSSILHDIQMKAPNIFSLFNDLGDTSRNSRSDTSNFTDEELKALTSLCTLANAKSQRAKGMQLFMSIMLIARAVNKQVRSLNCRRIIMGVYITYMFRFCVFSIMPVCACPMT